ncbi:MAG TPA: hypothetical protein VHT75_06935 [Acidimicrobiales bacterium]|jgi:hypothetical protein|nr:hypothetical protein [Acidimicrobiales bacterium]
MTVSAPAADLVSRPWRLAALGLLVVIVVVESALGAVLAPAPRPHAVAGVMALPGVATMSRGASIDPTELTQVAAVPAPHDPLAYPAMAVLDALLLVTATAAALSQLAAPSKAARAGRFASFLASLAILLVGIAVVVGAVARLRFLTALYLSPPFGTLTYLLRYGIFPRTAALVALVLLMAGKAAACAALDRGDLAGSGGRSVAARGAAGLAVTTVAATVVTAACYAWAPPALVPVTDALAAAVVGLAAIGWAGVMVSGAVRRLA